MESDGSDAMCLELHEQSYMEESQRYRGRKV